jgi:HEPN domain-containing protein
LRQAEELTVHAVGSRYPGEEPPLDREEAKEWLAIANQVLAHVRTLLGAYLDAGRPAGN